MPANPSKCSKPAHHQPGLLDTANLHEERCCLPGIPQKLLAILENYTVYSSWHLLRAYVQFEGRYIPYETMCHSHLQKFAEAIMKTEPLELPLKVEKDLQMPSSGNRRRRASLSDIATDCTPLKKLRLGDSTLQVCGPSADGRPNHDRIHDEAYRQQVLRELELTKLNWVSHGAQTNNLVRKILLNSKQPTADEAHFCTGDEAAMKAELGSVDAPIFTQGQQQSRWDSMRRPISQLFRSMEDLGLDRTISVQVPSRNCQMDSCEEKTLREVRDRFLNGQPTNDPWNLLDLQNPLPSILPSFLEGENCQLLLRIRDAVLMGESAERHIAFTEDWNIWRNVTEWALLSEGGHNTAPHMDSHGYSTWIKVQEGHIGFGWMSRPTQEERDAWMSNPHSCTGGEWRYIILRPGDIVFFTSGTIHFVFRTRRTQTFALGSHILQWSSIVEWIEIVIAQMRNSSVTNENLDSMPKIVHVVVKLVTNRIKTGRVEEMGGRDAVKRFLALVEVRGLSRLMTYRLIIIRLLRNAHIRRK